MYHPAIKERGIINECIFNAVRSSGPGGQNVNKVSSKIELRLNILESSILVETEKQILLKKLRSRISIGGELILTSQTTRSQLKNKELVIEKFYNLIEKALIPAKKRKPGSPTLSSIEKRIENKKRVGKKKKLRGNPGIE